MSFETIRARLINAQQARTAILAMCEQIKPWMIAGHQLQIEVRADTRSTAANRLFWSCLNDISRQVEWPVDGKMQKLPAEDWKHIFSGALKQHQRAAQGIDGGFVILGQSTSKYTRSEMTEQIDLIHAFGDTRGVSWSRSSLGRDVPDEVCQGVAA